MDPYLSGVLLKHDFKSLTIDGKRRSEFTRAIRNVEIKLLALKYHIDNMDRLEKIFHKEDLEAFPEDSVEGKFESISVPLDFEFEAAIFQSRACLEVLCNAIGLRCGDSRYSPKSLVKKLEERKKSLERKGDNFVASLLKCIQRHYFPFFIHLDQEGYVPIRDRIAHYGPAKLGPFTTSISKNGKAVSSGPQVFGNYPVAASAFCKQLLHSTEWLAKDSISIMLGIAPPTEEQFLIKAEDLTRYGIYSFESAWDWPDQE